MLGFNPEYGEQGSKYAAKLDARQVLTMLLDTLILKNVKKNGLVFIKSEILASAEIKALFKSMRSRCSRSGTPSAMARDP